MKMRKFLGLFLGLVLIVSPGVFAATNVLPVSDIITKGPWVDSRAYSTLAAANTAAYNAGKPLYITKNYTLTGDTTLTAVIHVLKGGGFTKASAYTLAISGPFTMGMYQGFYGFSAGDVIFGQGKGVNEVYPEWWGADASDAVDDLAAINNAVASIQKRGVVFFGKGEYRISAAINVTGEAYVTLRGASNPRSSIITTGATDAIVFDNMDYGVVENLDINGGSIGLNGITLTNTCNKNTIRNVAVKNFTLRGVWFSGQSTVAPVMGSLLQNFVIGNTPIGVEVNYGAGIWIKDGNIGTFSTNAVKVTGDSAAVVLSTVIIESYTGAANGVVIYWDSVRGGTIENIRGETAYNATYIKIVSNDAMGTIIRGCTISESGDAIQDNGHSTVIVGNYLTPYTGYYCIKLLSSSNRAQILQNFYYAVSGSTYWFSDGSVNKNYTRMDEVMTRAGGTGGGYFLTYGTAFRAETGAGADILTGKVVGDANYRTYFNVDGSWRMGDGTASMDTKVGRVAAGIFGSLEAGDGLAVGNAETATGAATGMVKKIQIFDHTGASLGYIPVYSAIAP